MIEYVVKIKRKRKSIFRDPWVWKMAWRDARHNFRRLFLLTASLVTGIAGVIAISSLNYTLQADLDKNAKELLGADLIINSNKRLHHEIVGALDSAHMKIARDADMASMVLFMNTFQSRLVKLTAMEGDFPFYGKMETLPVNAPDLMKTGRYAMLDETLATQYEISSDDSLKIGNTVFKVAGVVKRMPGSGGLGSTLAPAVYISMNALDSTGLIQFGSRIGYSLYVKTLSDTQTDEIVKQVEPLTKKYGFSYETVEGRKKGLGQSFQSVYRFFAMLAFVALILGCLGVASSVHIYAREKREEVALLRCVGSSGWQAFNIYFIQVFILGILGSVVGAAIGMGIQQLVPVVFKDFVPVELSFGISWRAVFEGLLLGTVVAALFSILPLNSVRFVPPLAVLRSDSVSVKSVSTTKWVTIALIGLFPVLAAAYQTKSILMGVFFAAGVGAALGCLTAVAIGLLYLVRRYFPHNAAFLFRHALSNLFRPNNQTRVLLVSIGLGAFIVSTLSVIEGSLLNQVEFSGNANNSNTILFDIQPNQKEGIEKLLAAHKLPANQVVPMITCRIGELKGRKYEQVLGDTTDKIPDWAVTREYRVTYRDSLTHSEELTKGQLQQFRHGQKDSVWVTVSEGMNENLTLDVGDSLVFNVQGVPIMTHISGIRKVDWPKDPPNFAFVFPKGVLDEAPKIWVAATKITDPQTSARFQQELVMSFPNVSLIDLQLILRTINELFEKIGLVVRFLALFSILTGLVVLAGAVINSKFARIRENVLLRTLGARTSQIMKITLIEYAYLGFFAAVTGLLLSVGSGWLLAKFFFEIEFAVHVLDLILIASGVIFLTVFIGWWNSREVINTPPLQILRKEN